MHHAVVIINIAVTALLVVYISLSKSKALGRLMGALQQQLKQQRHMHSGFHHFKNRETSVRH